MKWNSESHSHSKSPQLIEANVYFCRLNELEDFSSLSFKPNHEKHCDVIVEKPTFFMKLDAGLFHLHVTVVLHFVICAMGIPVRLIWESSKSSYTDQAW